MKKCAIITSYIEGNLHELMGDFQPDFILCADGGYDHAVAAGMTPHLLIGDLDSIAVPTSPAIETILYPSEKDDTDTGLCLEEALNRGYTDILIIGGLGGRFDHTMSNIQLITGKCTRAHRISIKDRNNSCTVLSNSSLTIEKKDRQYISLFSMTSKCTGVSAAGFKYPLDNAELPLGSTLGTSNECIEDQATISVKDGILLVITSKEGDDL